MPLSSYVFSNSCVSSDPSIHCVTTDSLVSPRDPRESCLTQYSQSTLSIYVTPASPPSLWYSPIFLELSYVSGYYCPWLLAQAMNPSDELQLPSIRKELTVSFKDSMPMMQAKSTWFDSYTSFPTNLDHLQYPSDNKSWILAGLSSAPIYLTSCNFLHASLGIPKVAQVLAWSSQLWWSCDQQQCCSSQ